MFALKAARDHLNHSSQDPHLFIVFTGSNRDKLAHLVLNRSQPFFGSRVTNFPLLSKAFTDAYTDWVNQKLAPDNQFAKDDMFAAFELVGHRPEMLKSIVGEIALDLGDASNLGELLRSGAQEWRDRNDIESEFSCLTPVQRAVLDVLVSEGSLFSPFTENSMQAYRAILGAENVITATIQAALDALREKNLIWRESS